MFNLSTDPNQPGTWRFNFLGFPVAVQWPFWLLAAFIGGATRVNSPKAFQELLVWVAVVFVSILVHELGHAFFQRRYGGRSRILLWGMGGLAIAEGRYTRNQSIVITLAGPLVQLILAIPFVIWYFSLDRVVIDGTVYVGVNTLLYKFVQSMMTVNIFWAILNLLPIYPLDGGQLLGHIMRDKKRELRAKIGMGVSIAAGVALFTWSGGTAILSLIMFGYLAYMNFQRAQPSWR